MNFIDSVSLQVPLPTTAVIFQQMILIAEKWDARDEKEHGEANFASSRRANSSANSNARRQIPQRREDYQYYGAKRVAA